MRNFVRVHLNEGLLTRLTRPEAASPLPAQFLTPRLR